MQKTLAEIADIIDGEIAGDANLIITGLSGIQEAEDGDLSFVANAKYFALARKTKASALIIPKNFKIPKKSAIRTENPSLAFARIASVVYNENIPPLRGIHPTAVIADHVTMGDNVVIGPCAVIEDYAQIGRNTVIHSGCHVGARTLIGENCLIYPNVTIRERVCIGHRVIIHSGTVVGSDGFGFVQVDGVHEKIPQIGTVIIGDDVEIGANVTIDRARFDKTVIGKGTKIDNLVQIAHNVHIGENCIIVSQVGISGSVSIGKGVILAGQAGVTGHLTIGDGVVVTAQSGVTKSIPAHTKIAGFPARPNMVVLKEKAALSRLPVYIKKIQELAKRVEQLERKRLKDGRKTKNN